MKPSELPKLLETITALEEKHRLQVVNKRLRPSVAFLTELGEKCHTTPTGAFKLWIVSSLWQQALADREEENAELSFWFNVNPYDLTSDQRIGLLANLGRVKCQDRLHRGDYDVSDWQGVYDLVLAAGGSELDAAKARASAIEAKMEASR